MSDKGKELLAKLGKVAPPDELPVWDEDLIPDIEETETNDPELDAFMSRIDILTAYQKWCGKMTPNPGSKRESIMISCPDPNHPDKHPSAWVNLDKQTWFCGTCQIGGDMYDIAAWHFGFPVPGYKDQDKFPSLVTQMAEDMGYVILTSPSGTAYVEPIEQDEPEGEPEAPPIATVTELPSALPSLVDLDELELTTPSDRFFIDWENLLPEDTFLRQWMEAATIDDLPHEYYFVLGLVAIGCAIGSNVLLDDFIPVKGNLYACLYGPTGVGKSRSISPFVRMIKDALPWAGDEYTKSSGTLVAPTPGSAEALHDVFRHDILDPSTQAVVERAQVRGLVKIDELAGFAARAARAGSTFKETLIELYDVYDEDMILKTLGGGVRIAHNPFCQIVSTTQPKAIHEFLSRGDEYSGFLNRWVVAVGHPRVTPISYGGQSHDLTAPTDSLRKMKQWADPRHMYFLEGPTYELWNDHYQNVIVPALERDEPILARMSLLEKKLIVLLTANMRLSQPTVETVQQAISLHRYLVNVLQLFSSHIRETEADQVWADVITALKGLQDRPNGKAGSRRELNQRIGQKHAAPLVTQALVEMVKAGIVSEKMTKGARGPATVRYEVVA